MMHHHSLPFSLPRPSSLPFASQAATFTVQHSRGVVGQMGRPLRSPSLFDQTGGETGRSILTGPGDGPSAPARGVQEDETAVQPGGQGGAIDARKVWWVCEAVACHVVDC